MSGDKKKKDYYEILGVEKNSSGDQIKKAYRKLAMKYHPDKVDSLEDEILKKEYTQKFKDIGEAYGILSDPRKRDKYDIGDSDYKQADKVHTPDRNYKYREDEDIEDFRKGSAFDDIFGDKGDDDGSMFDDFFGDDKKKKEPKVEKRKYDCGKKPKDDGGCKKEDTCSLKDDLEFKVSGSDTILETPIGIPYSIAALGGIVKVPTFYKKKINVRIKPGFQSHSKLRLPGYGKDGGDQYITVVIKTPKNLSASQKRLLEQLAKYD